MDELTACWQQLPYSESSAYQDDIHEASDHPPALQQLTSCHMPQFYRYAFDPRDRSARTCNGGELPFVTVRKGSG
jgi:hypothetical protein